MTSNLQAAEGETSPSCTVARFSNRARNSAGQCAGCRSTLDGTFTNTNSGDNYNQPPRLLANREDDSAFRRQTLLLDRTRRSILFILLLFLACCTPWLQTVQGFAPYLSIELSCSKRRRRRRRRLDYETDNKPRFLPNYDWQLLGSVNGEARSSRSNSNKENNNNNKKSSMVIPRHVAFVCDGNSRWARQRGLPVIAGHAAGADRLVDVVLPSLQKVGVQYCTMYGFSTENWNRSSKEIAEIFSVMEHTAHKVYERLQTKNGEKGMVRIKILGDMTDKRIPHSLRNILLKLERETNNDDKHENETNNKDDYGDSDDKATLPPASRRHTLCLAVNYGGRQDILEAAKKLAKAATAANKQVNVNDLTERDFAQLLCTRDIPDPDLIIRTSGECRLSNFLAWNAAYSELYFVDTLWPDFDNVAMAKALDWYSHRKRRFGARREEQEEDPEEIQVPSSWIQSSN